MNAVNSSESLWWREGVIYHIYLRSFADSNGDGLGDLPGLIAHLDHLNGNPDALGVDALWISPPYPSPDKDFGYDVADYHNIDPRYGTLSDFDRLISEAHKRGMRVMLDLVINHSSDLHPWFLESRASRHNPKRDWYLWRDARSGGRPPNNWQSVFGGSAWEWDQTTHQYYYHMFLKGQPDLNWRNPAVRKALMDMVRFWLDRGVDGFRLDVFNLWFKHPDLPDNPRRLGLRGFSRQHHLYDYDQPEMIDALAELRTILDSYSQRAAVGETFGPDPRRVASYCGDEKLHMAFSFEFTECPWQPAAFLKAIQRWEKALEGIGWPCYVLSNHDKPCRHVSRYGGRHPDAVAKVAATLLLTLRGTPFLYYGEEIGMPNVPLRRSQLLDPASRRYWPFLSRDSGRAPMQWDRSPNAGFTTSEPWLPIHHGYQDRNVAAQRKDPLSIFSFYRDLIRLRRRSPALHKGSFKSLTSHPTRGLAYLREAPKEQALIGLNFSHRPYRLRLDYDLIAEDWSMALSSLPDSTSVIAGGEIELGPHEAVVFLRS